jgi:hypothetical protein
VAALSEGSGSGVVLSGFKNARVALVAASGGGVMPAEVIAGAVLLGLWVMWRRRSGRRAADAQERMAGVIAPLPPKGRYPRPAASTHRGSVGVAEVDRVCLGCRRFVRGGGVTTDRVILWDACSGCVADQRELA